jgi:hypothetical protein
VDLTAARSAIDAHQCIARRPAIEDADKGCGGQHRDCQSKHKVDKRLGRHANVVGDAVFRILRRIPSDAQLIESPVREPPLDQLLRQPAAPFDLQSHLAMHVGSARSCGRYCEREDELNAIEDAARVLAFEGVEKETVPAIDADLNEQIGEYEGQGAEG